MTGRSELITVSLKGLIVQLQVDTMAEKIREVSGMTEEIVTGIEGEVGVEVGTDEEVEMIEEAGSGVEAGVGEGQEAGAGGEVEAVEEWSAWKREQSCRGRSRTLPWATASSTSETFAAAVESQS